MKKLFSFILAAFLTTAAQAKLNVVTTTEDTAAIARDIGQNLVSVESLSKGYMDPHFVDAKPSYLLKLRNADVFVEVGLELEVGWAPSLLTSARNPKILPGAPGFLEASQGCEILQKTNGRVDRTMGDVHPFGNPHYWLDPDNGLVMARNLAEKFSSMDAANAETYKANLSAFEAKLKEKDKSWTAALAPYKGTRIVTYHNSWPNFAEHFGLDVAYHVEPKAGIPPSPGHIQDLTQKIKAEKIPVILVEPYFDTKLPEKIARDTGCKMLVLAPSVGADSTIKTYFDLFDRDVAQLKSALDAQGGR